MSNPKLSHTLLPDTEDRTGMPLSRMYEQGLTLAAMGFHEEATEKLREVTALAPGHGPAWKMLAELLRLAGKDDEAATASLRAATTGTAWPPASCQSLQTDIEAAERALRGRMREIAGPLEQLEALREQSRHHQTDVAALRLLGIAEWREGNLMTARALFKRVLALAPEYQGARGDLAQLLHSLGEEAGALVEARRLFAEAAEYTDHRALYADVLCGIGDFNSAIPIMEQLLGDQPANAHFRCVYAQTLRYAGRREDSARELRTALALQPGMGEAYWCLAELRGDYVTDDDVAAMRVHLLDDAQSLSSRMLLEYALGRALERRGEFAASFAAYQAGAALSREIAASANESYDQDLEAERLNRRRVVFSAPLFARAAKVDRPDCTPIFVIGMPRAGSTLVEQILASHSLVEATTELPSLDLIVRDLSLSRLLVEPDAYPECVSDLANSQLAALGARYLEEANFYRKSSVPYFVDKRPRNWANAGLIRLILPHAKIIDVRREPMAACFAMYKQMLPPEFGAFSTDFNDLVHYYTQYIDMMAHYQNVMPGHIHLLSYEQLIENTESEIRRLLDYCGLPFEDRCLRFWETKRAIATPSAEQVRHPIFRNAMQQWRNFEPWLAPLKGALKAAEAEVKGLPQPQGYDLALTLDAMGMREGALEEMRAVTKRCSSHPGAWQRLAELLRLSGDDEAAARADTTAANFAAEGSKWRATRDTRTQAQLADAERKLQERCVRMGRAGQMDLLRDHLVESPTDAAAAYMLGRLEHQNGDPQTATTLLERTLQLSPLCDGARAELASVLLHRKHSFDRALDHIQRLRRRSPKEARYRAMESEARSALGDFPAALAISEELVQEQPRNPLFWYGYGELLQCVGRRDDSVRALRTALELSPTTGQVWWALADQKSGHLTEADIAGMRACLADPSLTPSSRMYIYYALGHALEESGDFSASFAAYEQGARLFRGFFLSRKEAYSENAHVEHLRRIKRAFTGLAPAKDPVPPCPSPRVTPIFVVGLPRAGSTLVEQILGSHSQIEATRELPTMIHLVQDLAQSRLLVTPSAYPECVRNMTPAQLTALGERYLLESRQFRKTDRPYFIDKQPWNWIDAGLIRMILPYAKIIDIRREPMAACFANFKQVLTDGADFSYDLHDLGRYYVEYAAMMEHWRSVMPGGILFVQYERLVSDTEREVRRMLDYCGLPFEENCLRFWQTKRAIPTPSAGQVRRPIYRDALERWRNFEPWLGPLKAALAMPARA